MLMVYCYFGCVWYGSGLMFMVLQSVPTYKEQLVAYYGVAILLNIRHLARQEVFVCLFTGVPLFNNYKEHENILLHD